MLTVGAWLAECGLWDPHGKRKEADSQKTDRQAHTDRMVAEVVLWLQYTRSNVPAHRSRSRMLRL